MTAIEAARFAELHMQGIELSGWVATSPLSKEFEVLPQSARAIVARLAEGDIVPLSGPYP